MKRRLSNLIMPDPALLPYNAELVSWLGEQRDSGRELVLCTAADQGIAEGVANHLGLFGLVLASDGQCNMKGTSKRNALVKRFSGQGFSYVGDTGADLVIWQAASSSVVVSNSLDLKNAARKMCLTEKEFSKPKVDLSSMAKLLRVHQWSKNLLLFIPAVAAHQISQIDLILTLVLAFVSFCLCSSAAYIANDLFDLENDRRHPEKCSRPFASGRISIASGLALFPLLLTASAVLALQISSAFSLALLLYFMLTCAYSVFFKRIVLLDCLVLAGLYTLRVIAGGVAISIGVSFWMLSFSVFLFLSLAYVKRFAELQKVADTNPTISLGGRGYYHGDRQFVQMLGIVAGFVAVLVLALYIDSTASAELYRMPEIVWGAVIILLYWVSWIWLKAHRGEMHDDPVVFAITDRVSLVCGLLFGGIIVLGTLGLNP